MASAQNIDFVADRTLYFVQPLVFVGDDFTGATQIAMDIRTTPDAIGSPLIALSIVLDTVTEGILLQYAGTATVSAHIAAGRLDSGIYNYINPATGSKYASTDSVVVSQLRIYALMDSRIPIPEVRGDNWVGAYDLIVDIAGTPPAQKYAYGKFTVRGAVTF